MLGGLENNWRTAVGTFCERPTGASSSAFAQGIIEGPWVDRSV